MENEFIIDSKTFLTSTTNPLNIPVENNEIRIVVLGSMGKGKTRIMLLLARFFNMIAPNLKVVLHDNDSVDPERTLREGYVLTQPEFTAEVLNKEKIEIHMYQMVTNYNGRLMGVGIKPAE